MEGIVPGSLTDLIGSWSRSLRARNLSAQTMTTYRSGAEQLDASLAAEGLTKVADVRRRHVEGFIAHLVEIRSAATAHVRYRSLQPLFNWLVDEEEIDRSPMERMKPPIIPEEPVEVVSDEDLRRQLKSVEGRDFVSRRDNAAIRLWLEMPIEGCSSATASEVQSFSQVRRRRRASAEASASFKKYAFRAWSTRRARSSGFSTPLGSTSRSKRPRNVRRAAAVCAEGSLTRACKRVRCHPSPQASLLRRHRALEFLDWAAAV